MGPFQYIVLLGGLACALFIVVGGLWLMSRGILKLDPGTASTGSGGETKIELYALKFATSYPALGLFGIALAFCLVAAMLGRPVIVTSLLVDGTVVGPDASSVALYVSPYPNRLVPIDGKVRERILPTEGEVIVMVVASGYNPPFDLRRAKLKGETIKLDLSMTGMTKLVDQRPVGPSDVESAPSKLPGPDAAPKF